MTGEPLPHCQFTVERAYEGEGPAYECVNRKFFDCADDQRRGDPRLRPAQRDSVVAGRLGTGGAVEPSYLADSPISRGCHPKTAPRLHTLARPTPRPRLDLAGAELY